MRRREVYLVEFHRRRRNWRLIAAGACGALTLALCWAALSLGGLISLVLAFVVAVATYSAGAIGQR